MWRGPKRQAKDVNSAGLMTFAEIGKRLGISGQYAHSIYVKAMMKLRRKFRYTPGGREMLRELLQDEPDINHSYDVDGGSERWFPKGIHLWNITPVPRTTRALRYTSRSVSDEFKKKRKKGLDF